MELFWSTMIMYTLIGDGSASVVQTKVPDFHAASVAVKAALNSGVPFGVVIPPQWKAEVTQDNGANTLGTAKGTITHDAVGKRRRITTTTLNTLFHTVGDEMIVDTLQTSDTDYVTVGKVSDSVCKKIPSPYYDMFGLLQIATRKGESSVGDEACDLWAGAIDYHGQHMEVSACVAADGVPRAFNSSSGLAYKAISTTSYVFSNVVVGPPDEADFALTDACTNHYPLPQCAQFSEVGFDVYRVRSAAEPNSLENRDVGDALGDMAFACDLAGLDATNVVTKWAVKANSSWGQYGYCLYTNGKNECFGHTGNHVGRESALGLGSGAVQGQCSLNDDVGSWFSFPAEGHCPEGTPLGTRGCTWIAEPIRTISAQCVYIERGLKASCAEELGHAPMTKSKDIFVAAFATSDPSRGGCPDAVPVSVNTLIV
eukprot:TRINITY_DN2562_c0_g2_i1.p1 TRINITY_DN2562_c0_g2~~TRINITY_DN2562_c0_g2_i1.p1  ORF type:complete len:427 (-),score=65.05 TRINITY_DN2562_c0_g2_i1:115-1395(-)